MRKRTVRLVTFLLLLVLLPLPAQGAGPVHRLWDIPPDINPGELITLVQERTGIALEISQYSNWLYLNSGKGQTVMMFGMPISLSAMYEKGLLRSITIAYLKGDGILYEGLDPTAQELDAAKLQALLSFLEVAKQLETKYGKFTGGQVCEVGEYMAPFPVDAQGRLDLDAFHDAMWASNESSLELYSENIKLGLSSYFEFNKNDDVLFCLSLYTEFTYGRAPSAGRTQGFLGGYPDVDAMASAAQAALTPGASQPTPAPVETATAPSQGSISLWDDKEAWIAKGKGGEYDVDVSVPQVAGMADQRVQDVINTALRQEIYAEAGSYESRRQSSEEVQNSTSVYYDYSYTYAQLNAAWVGKDVLAVYCGVGHGGSGIQLPVVLYFDMTTGQQLFAQPLFKNEKAANEVIGIYAWAAFTNSDSFYDLSFADVQDTEPYGYWLSPEGLTVIYGDETLHRRQMDVLIPWESIGAYIAPGHAVYEAVSGARMLGM